MAFAPVDAQVISQSASDVGVTFKATFKGKPEDLGITVKWSGMFVDSAGKAIAGTDFALSQVNPHFVAAAIRRQELPSKTVRLYAPGATKQ